MSNLYVAIDKDNDGNMWIVGIFPSLDQLTKTVDYIMYKEINLDYLDSGFYVDEDGEIRKSHN